MDLSAREICLIMQSTIDRLTVENAIDALILKQHGDPGMVEYIKAHRERLIRTLMFMPLGRQQLSVVDVGTTGFMLYLFYQLLGYKDATGILWKESGSPYKGCIDYFSESYPVAYLDAEKDIYTFEDESFDVITSFEVIEHFTCDPMFFLLQASRVLKKDGILVISTPNSASYEAFVNLCRGDPPMLFYKYVQGSSDRHHIEYTPKLLSDLVHAAGFNINTIVTIDDKPSVRSGNCKLFRAAEDFIRTAGLSAEHRERRIFLVASKNSKGAPCRYPDFMYHPS